jgi:hypothetical protein
LVIGENSRYAAKITPSGWQTLSAEDIFHFVPQDQRDRVSAERSQIPRQTTTHPGPT